MNAKVETKMVILMAIAGCALFFISFIIRLTAGIEAKNIDIVLAFLPISLWLLGTGKIRKFTLGILGMEFGFAFTKALIEPIEDQVAMPARGDVVEAIEIEEKDSVKLIPRLIEKRTEALVFVLRDPRYQGPAIKKYFKSLSAYSFFRYVVILDESRKYFGFMRSSQLVEYFREQGADIYEEFASQLKNADDRLKDLPGFMSADDAVKHNAEKGKILEKMEDLKVDTLPAIDDNGEFSGIIERSRLTASLIIDITKYLESAKYFRRSGT